MFALRLLIALCAVPLVAAAFTGVGYLTVRVHSPYLLLGLACVALALMVGWHLNRLVSEDESPGGWLFASGVVLVVAAITGYVLTIGWAAPRHTCTVVEAGTWSRLTPGGEETHNYRRLACDDGSAELLGGNVAPPGIDITDTTDRHKGTRMQVAYDPNGQLPSMNVNNRIVYLILVIIGMALLVMFHIGAVLNDQGRRRSENSSPARK